MKAKSVYGLITPNHYLYMGLREIFYDVFFIKIDSLLTLCKYIGDDLTVIIDDSVFETDSWPDYIKALRFRGNKIIWIKERPEAIYTIEMAGDLLINKDDDLLKLKFTFSLISTKKASASYDSIELSKIENMLLPLFLVEGDISVISRETNLKSKTLYYYRNQIARKFGFSCFSKLRGIYIKNNVLSNL
ncbi:hypothetical protein KW823_10115 [Enterobacter quasiroggenkampii]|nr:hypothetical protein [Enterobacter quasiroggenkampii]